MVLNVRSGGLSKSMQDKIIRCPYGAPGDRLWVRETWGLFDRETCGGASGYLVAYRATDPEGDRAEWIDGPDGHREDARGRLAAGTGSTSDILTLRSSAISGNRPSKI
jgi:hypothetical protein